MVKMGQRCLDRETMALTHHHGILAKIVAATNRVFQRRPEGRQSFTRFHRDGPGAGHT